MYANMCVKIALSVVLFVCVNCHVLTPKEVPLPPEGLTIEVAVKSRSGDNHPISVMKIDIDEVHKKVIISNEKDVHAMLRRNPKHGSDPPEDIKPTLENRVGIVDGKCPAGHTRYGDICFPDNIDYY